MDVMFYEVYREEEVALRKHLPEHIKAEFTEASIQASGHISTPAPIISIRTQSQIPLDWSTDLRAILTRSAGFDHLLDYQNKISQKISLGSLGPYCARAVAEQALLLSLALLRKLSQQIESLKHFERNGLCGRELKNQAVLVIGVGHIGQEIIRVFKALGCSVKGVDIEPTVMDVEYIDLNQGARDANIIICALPLTKQTQGLLDYDILKNCPKQSLFINISRGEISPIEDLRRLLKEGVLAGLALDVYEDEKILAQYLRGETDVLSKAVAGILALQSNPNVILTPHNAFNTQEALINKAKYTAEAITLFWDNGQFANQI
jgi:D-lactate dehydrogenase